MDKKTAYLLFGIFFVVVGVVLSIIGTKSLNNAKENLEWPKTQGKIITSEMDIKRTKTGNSNSWRNEYSARILYNYEVNGSPYTSNKTKFINTISKKHQDIKPILSRYKVGTDVSVYYKPSDPETAVLKPGVTKETYIPLGIGIIIFIVGAGFIISVYKS